MYKLASTPPLPKIEVVGYQYETGFYDFGFVDHGHGVAIKIGEEWLDISGCGMLKSEALREAGYDPDNVGGITFGFGLERMAMLKFGIDDVRKLWQPPYVPDATRE